MGMFTRPKLMDPDQIARAIAGLVPVATWASTRNGALVRAPRLVYRELQPGGAPLIAPRSWFSRFPTCATRLPEGLASAQLMELTWLWMVFPEWALTPPA